MDFRWAHARILFFTQDRNRHIFALVYPSCFSTPAAQRRHLEVLDAMEHFRWQYARPMDEARLRNGVEEWLAHVELHESSSSTRGLEESETDEKLPPATPIRSREAFLTLSFDEVSPTNTNFSNTSIFDNVQINPAVRNGDNASESSATTIDEELEGQSRDGKQMEEEEEDVITPSEALSSNYVASLSSIGPPTKDFLFLAIPTLPTKELAPLDLSKPRLVWITSCLQCTLAGLPCSRTPPSCSRCTRKGEAEMCLLRRRKLGEERVRGDNMGNRLSVLLKLPAQSEVWAKKLDLAAEVRGFQSLKSSGGGLKCV